MLSTLFLSQHEFLQRHSVANGAARFNGKVVEAWVDGVTPPVLQKNFVDAPNNEEDDDVTEEPSLGLRREPSPWVLGLRWLRHPRLPPRLFALDEDLRHIDK